MLRECEEGLLHVNQRNLEWRRMEMPPCDCRDKKDNYKKAFRQVGKRQLRTALYIANNVVSPGAVSACRILFSSSKSDAKSLLSYSRTVDHPTGDLSAILMSLMVYFVISPREEKSDTRF